MTYNPCAELINRGMKKVDYGTMKALAIFGIAVEVIAVVFLVVMCI